MYGDHKRDVVKEFPMEYSVFFKNRLKELRSEGRYRVFADLKRHAGAYPHALFMIMTVLLGMWSFGVVTITWGWARMN